VAGNIRHFSELGGDYSGIRILTPRRFLEVLQECGSY
jgi:hypothetical protein